jgi:hypothetical protein
MDTAASESKLSNQKREKEMKVIVLIYLDIFDYQVFMIIQRQVMDT